jgi:hypothetical protein
MKIELTKKQLKTLLELVYLGNWMVNAHRTGSKEDPIIQEHDDLAHYIYAQAGKAGLDKEVQYVEDLKNWYVTYDFEMEGNVSIYHDEYDDNNFWDELRERLALRDFNRIYSEKEIDEMSIAERIEKREPFIEKYEKELYENGLDRLIINENQNNKTIGRNEPCICGSGKKYKKCCGE